MNLRNSKVLAICLAVVTTLTLSWSVYRDIQSVKQFPGDLRNRVVGSRMQKDGLSPYFYHWRVGDSMRYYDWNNHTTYITVSNVTATPFFHQLLTPISGFPHYTIAFIWLVLNYIALAIMVFLAMMLTRNSNQKFAVWITAILFLFTYAWTGVIYNGQMYLFIGLLAMMFYVLLRGKPGLLQGTVAGVIAMSLILIRPTTILFLLPFLLLWGKYTAKFKTIFVIGGMVVAIFAFSGVQSRFFWTDYRKAVTEHLKFHQNLGAVRQDTVYLPEMDELEGFKKADMARAAAFPFYVPNDANGNVFVFINHTLGVHVPLWLLSTLCVAFMAIVIFLFARTHLTKSDTNLYAVALLGFLLYMASDIFSPIHRFQYNASQWAFPLLLTASAWSPRFNKPLVSLALLGMVLNSLPFSMFPMQQSVGEYLIYLSILSLLLTYKSDPVA
jgi:hypothetical protein